MKYIINCVIFIVVLIFLSGCNPKVSKTVVTNGDLSTISNEYFFADSNTLHNFSGVMWNQDWFEEEWINEEGEINITGKLEVTKLLSLKDADVFTLTFSSSEPEFLSASGFSYNIDGYQAAFPETIYLLVSDDKIYLVTDDSLEKLSSAKGKSDLVTDDQVICQEVNMQKISGDGLWTENITLDGDSVKYIKSHNNGHFLTFYFKKDKGLTEYSYGYGARKYGLKILIND